MLLARAVHHDRALVRAYVQFTLHVLPCMEEFRVFPSPELQACQSPSPQAPKKEPSGHLDQSDL